MQKAIIVVVLTMLLMLEGCGINSSINNSPNVGLVTICKKAPYKSYLNKSAIIKTDTIHIYHRDGFVTKTVLDEVSVLANSGGLKDLEAYEESMHLMFDQALFPSGFTYSTKLTGKSVTLITTYDYTKMNIKEELEKGKELFHVHGNVDENYKIPYDQVIKAYKKIGFVCE